MRVWVGLVGIYVILDGCYEILLAISGEFPRRQPWAVAISGVVAVITGVIGLCLLWT